MFLQLTYQVFVLGKQVKQIIGYCGLIAILLQFTSNRALTLDPFDFLTVHQKDL